MSQALKKAPCKGKELCSMSQIFALECCAFLVSLAQTWFGAFRGTVHRNEFSSNGVHFFPVSLLANTPHKVNVGGLKFIERVVVDIFYEAPKRIPLLV